MGDDDDGENPTEDSARMEFEARKASGVGYTAVPTVLLTQLASDHPSVAVHVDHERQKLLPPLGGRSRSLAK
jgi:hypothetical protein